MFQDNLRKGGEDLDFREERVELKHSIKKHIPLRIISSGNLQSNTNNNSNLNPHLNHQYQSHHQHHHHNHHHQQYNNNQIQTGSHVNSSPVFQLALNNNTNKSFDEQSTPQMQNFNENNRRHQYTHNPYNHNQQTPPLINLNHQIITSQNWNLNVNTSCKKIVDQKMDLCMLCSLPIVIYGRLIPCKHVTCIKCANTLGHMSCIKDRCLEKIERIEQVPRGHIFVCTYDQDQYKNSQVDKFQNQSEMSQKNLCGRSYMSQRDLDAHIRHRHDPNLKVNDYEIMQN